jgi:hypothetical protein
VDDVADMHVALRVLTALVDHSEPDPEDVAALRKLVPPYAANWDADEMACEVIRQSRKRRAEASGSG